MGGFKLINPTAVQNLRLIKSNCHNSKPSAVMWECETFNDVVHGYMSFHPLVTIFIDTKQIQRLRNLKQLGMAYYVHPSASHNRFEHSLGVAHLAGELFDNLKKNSTIPDIQDTETWEKRRLCLQIAGLCHDVGHGPFSHTWESFRKRVNPEDHWKHEDESSKIFDEILEESLSPTKRINGLENVLTVKEAANFFGLRGDDFEMIKNMIKGDSSQNYLYQIINSLDNKIDVDKWEYLARDSVMLNIPVSFDHRGLLKHSRILPNQDGDLVIAYREKDVGCLVDLFLSRGFLHDRAYNQLNVSIISEMVVDAFLLADQRFNFSTTPTSMLTDHIYYQILYDTSEDKSIQKAKNILKRIESRHWYECIASKEFSDCSKKMRELERALKEFLRSFQFKAYENRIVIRSINFNMTKCNRKKTLGRKVYVYNKNNECRLFDWDSHETSLKVNLNNLRRFHVFILNKEDPIPNHLKEKLKSWLESLA